MSKKSMFKRICSLFMVAVMGLSLCACGGGDEKVSSGYTDDESVPYEIVWYYVGNSSAADLEQVNAKVNEYLKEKINATVKMTPLGWGPFATKMENIMSSGEKYDLRWVNGTEFTKAALKGAFIDVDALMTEYAPKTRALLGEDFIDGARLDGVLYGVQANKDKAGGRSIQYRIDLAEKYNMDLSGVKTWEDMYPFFEIIKQNEPTMYAYNMGGDKEPLVLEKVEMFGNSKLIGISYGSHEVQNLYEMDEFMHAAKRAREVYEKGYIYKDVAVAGVAAGDFMTQGKIFASLFLTKPGKLEEQNAKSKWEWGEIQLTEAVTDMTMTTGSMMAIPVTCENPVRVMKFIELLNTDKYLNNLINFGIEGEHYTKVDENRIELIEKSGYSNAGWQWVYGNIFENYLYGDKKDDEFEQLKKFNEEATLSPYLGFVPNFDPVKIQYSSCMNVVDEFYKVICFGTVDPEEVIPKCVEKLKQAGIDEIVAEIQTQYDEWRAANK